MRKKVIAIMQKKGGATKTTTSVNLMMALNSLGEKSCLFDMDSTKPDAIYWADNGTELSNLVFPLFESNPKFKVEEQKKSYDFVIIDTPPQFETAALKAALLADLCIIPCSPSALDMKSLEDAAECAILAEKPFKFLAGRVVKNTNIKKELDEAFEQTGDAFATQITNSVNVLGATTAGQWVGSYKPESNSHKQFVDLAKEVITFFGE